MDYVNGPTGQITGNESALLIHDDGDLVVGSADGTTGRRHCGRLRREEPRHDKSASAAIALIAEIFVDDMLRLERDHGLNADEMLAYYKGERRLEQLDGRP